MNAVELKSLALVNIEHIAQELLPEGRKMAGNYRCGSLRGDKGTSFSLSLSGPKKGVWKDFESSDSGDIYDLWMKVRGCDFKEAFHQMGEFLKVKTDDIREVNQNRVYTKPNKSGIGKLSDEILNYLINERKLKEETIEKLSLGRIKHDKYGETFVFPVYHPETLELTKLKYLAMNRINGKKNTWVSKNSEDHLYGWNHVKANQREVIIFEGELDHATAIQWGFNGLSLPMGVNGMEWIENDFDSLARFEKIYLCFDMDDPGEVAFDLVSKRLGPERCYKVVLPCKDVNEMLIAGDTKADFEACINNAKTIDPLELSRPEDYIDVVTEYMLEEAEDDPATSRSPWDIEWLIRPAEITLWTGINSHGKTTGLSQVTVFDGMQGHKTCIAGFEMIVKKLISIAIRQAIANYPRSEDDVIKAINFLQKCMVFLYYEDEVPYQHILDRFLYAHRRYGCDRFVVDSLLYCVDTEDLAAQKKVVKAFRQFATKYNVHFHLVAHSRKGTSEAIAPGKFDVSGSGDITNIVDNGISWFRNKAKERGEHTDLQADATMTFWKQRETGVEPFVPLYYRSRSMLFVQDEDERVVPYISRVELN